MKYEIDIYKNNSENTLRFSLGKSGKKPLFVIGLNPSTADKNKPDRTITKIMKFAEDNNYDGFIVFNLYPQRTPNPDKLDKSINYEYHKQNLQIINSYLQKYSEINILCAWGESIMIRNYLKKCLYDLIEILKNSNVIWWRIGDFTKTGHPRHPSRVAYLELKPLDINSYMTNLK